MPRRDHQHSVPRGFGLRPGAFLLCLLVAWCAGTTFATSSFRSDPTYLIDTWEMEDGLPENSATAMAQTPDGYLWFGTWRGLVRFDGVQFTVLHPGNTAGLPDAGIVNLHLDKRGWLWVSTLRGMAVLAGEQWRAFGTNEGWAGDYARTFAERRNGDLLITSFDGKVLEFAHDRLTQLPSPPGRPGQGYLGQVDEMGQWWVAQFEFVGRWDGRNWVSMVVAPRVNSAVDKVGFTGARDGGMWLFMTNALCRIRGGIEVSRLSLPEALVGVWNLSEDSRGNVWICTTERGVCRVSPTGEMRRWSNTNGLSVASTRFVFEDREQNLWVGTSGGGLGRFKSKRFRSLGTQPGEVQVLVSSVSPSAAGDVWVGTHGQGLYRQSIAGSTRVALPRRDERSYPIQSVLEDRSGRVWVGTHERGLWLIGKDDTRLLPTEQAGGVDVTAMFEDSHGRVWVAGGQTAVVHEGGTFRSYGAPDGLPGGRVLCFAEDGSGGVWFAHQDGVFRFDGQRFAAVEGEGRRPLTGITCLRADTRGSMWMGSANRGLVRWRDGGMETVDARSGLPAQAIHSIVEDKGGFWWMTSEVGIVRVSQEDLQAAAEGSPVPLRCQVLDVSDGLLNRAFSTEHQPASTRDAAGRLWFAMNKGFAMIDPGTFRLNTNLPPVRIEAWSYRTPGGEAGGAPSRASTAGGFRLSAPFAQPLRLPPGSRQIEIRYTALSFSAPEKVRFQVRLGDRDADWQEMGTQRTAYYHELPPGHYEFQVRAANDDGVWNPAGTGLAFTVSPFYWQTMWFRGASGLLLAVGGGVTVRWRNRAKRKRDFAELERARERLEERRAADENFRLAVEASPSGITLVDGMGHIVLVNAETERLFGYPRDEMIGQPLELLVPERHRAAHSGERRAFMASPRRRAMGAGGDLFGRRKDGTEFPVEIGLSPICATGGVLVLAAIVDLTARKLAEAETQRQRAELAHVARVSTMGELAASVAHELNQPLGAILANAEAADLYLNMNPPALDELREILADIRKDDERASEVIRRMRALLRKQELERLPLELNSVVEDVLQVVSGDAALRKIAISAELAPSLPLVLGDRVHLQQVLLNLMLNAMDAMDAAPRERRRVSIRTRPGSDGHVELSVTDLGHGIEPERLPRLFEPFFTTKPSGMGMGLSISRTIIEAHGGRVTAENNAAGGAVFRVLLPGEGGRGGSKQ